MEQTAEIVTGQETPEVVIEAPAETQAANLEPLFEDEQVPTEAELIGAEAEAEPTREAEAPVEGMEPSGDKSIEPAPSEADLKNTISQLQSQVIHLNNELAQAQAQHEPGPEDNEGFKVLSDEEFQDLAEDDPSEAAIYLKKLEDHKARQKEIQAQLHHEAGIINQSWKDMSESVEGFADPKNPIRKNLTDFALKSGFCNEDLIAITSPGTLVMAPGEKQFRILGKGAAEVVKVIHQLYASKKATTQGKSPTGAAKTGSVLGGPAGGLGHEQQGFTEADYAKMSEEEREAALRG